VLLIVPTWQSPVQVEKVCLSYPVVQNPSLVTYVGLIQRLLVVGYFGECKGTPLTAPTHSHIHTSHVFHSALSWVTAKHHTHLFSDTCTTSAVLLVEHTAEALPPASNFPLFVYILFYGVISSRHLSSYFSWHHFHFIYYKLRLPVPKARVRLWSVSPLKCFALYFLNFTSLGNSTGDPRVFWVSDVVGLLPRIFWIFWAKNHPNWLRIDWVMVQNWFEASSFKTDVTAPVNVTKNAQKTRHWW